MRRKAIPVVWTLAASCLVYSLTACGGSEYEDPNSGSGVGQKDKDYGSTAEREHLAPDEFYDYGDYDFVKVFRLKDGTQCVLAHNNNQGGEALVCDFKQPVQEQ